MELYKNQVKLLLDVMPIVAEEEIYALHGGTAINLFVRDMPRLSVDIDLTYVKIEGRDETVATIGETLERIKARIESTIPGSSVQHQKDKYKLQVSSPAAQIKIEVNPNGRGLIAPTRKMMLCDKTQEDFDTFCAINVVSLGQLYGGKICAALDRQHPRDLFDVKYLLDNEGFTEEIKTGFMLYLLSSDRPIHEVVSPNLLDQRDVMVNHFDGMTSDKFTYDDFESTRARLIKTIHDNLNESDKSFIINFESGNPVWDLHDFSDFPAVRWKLQNLKKFITADPKRHQQQQEELRTKLS